MHPPIHIRNLDTPPPANAAEKLKPSRVPLPPRKRKMPSVLQEDESPIPPLARFKPPLRHRLLDEYDDMTPDEPLAPYQPSVLQEDESPIPPLARFKSPLRRRLLDEYDDMTPDEPLATYQPEPPFPTTTLQPDLDRSRGPFLPARKRKMAPVVQEDEYQSETPLPPFQRFKLPLKRRVLDEYDDITPPDHPLASWDEDELDHMLDHKFGDNRCHELYQSCRQRSGKSREACLQRVEQCQLARAKRFAYGL